MILAAMISEQTGVTIGVALPVLLMLWRIVRLAIRFDKRLETIEAKDADRYTLTAASEDALRTAIHNPGLKVPDPRRPGQVFEVSAAGEK